MKVLFCGGCNSLYDRNYIYDNIKDKNSNVIVILNGCYRGCKKVEENCRLINTQDFFVSHSYQYWEKVKILEWILSQIEIL